MKPETGRLISGPTGQPMIVRIDGDASRGAYSVIEYSHAAGALGPPAHVHHHHEEAFYVIDGELTLARPVFGGRSKCGGRNDKFGT